VKCAAALIAVALSGCGLGAGKPPSHVSLTVSEDFGARPLVQTEQPHRGGSDTVMRLLQRNARVDTRYGGGFVQSIDGRAGSAGTDWFYYVNGVEAPRGAASTKVHDGDHVWWDRHRWRATMRVPAVVGAYPEPFVHGVDGKRLPVRIECAQPRGADCRAISDALIKLGLIPGKSALGAGATEAAVRVLIGPWPALRVDRAAVQLERGPRASGVYARIAPDGASITALDARGGVAQRLGPGAGLVAATRVADEAPTWVVTGTDAAGVSAAASAFAQGESTLGDKFALAISDGRGVPLPAP